MIKSFLKLGQYVGRISPFLNYLNGPLFYFGAKVEPAKAAPAKPPAGGAGGKGGASETDTIKSTGGGSNVKVKSETPYIGVPPREPLDKGEWHMYEKLTEKELFQLMNVHPKPIKHSAYVSVEKKGKVYHLFDAERIPFGKMCHKIVYYLQGKHNPFYRHDSLGYGDICVVVNASKMKFTGKKIFQKKIRFHSGFIGGLKEKPYHKMLVEKPEQLLCRALSKMLPKNRLRYKYLDNLHIFREKSHDITHVLPNFATFHQNYDDLYKRFDMPSKEAGDVVIYEDPEEIPLPETKDLPRNYDPKIEIPIDERGEPMVKSTAYNRKVMAEYEKYQRRLKRYKEYKPKPPKDRSLDKLYAQGESVIINRDWKLKKFGFQEDYDLVEKEIDED